jgi:stearoyl-CoA desaturase (delta-9 desaturase)
MYITLMRYLRLARVNKVAPRPVMQKAPESHVSIDNLRAIIVNRMHVLRDYTRHVTLPVFRMARSQATGSKSLRKARKLLIRRPLLLDDSARSRLNEILSNNSALQTVHEFRERLSELWSGANVSNEKLLENLKDWCRQAEESGIQVLEDFARRLRSYQLAVAH